MQYRIFENMVAHYIKAHYGEAEVAHGLGHAVVIGGLAAYDLVEPGPLI